MPTLKKISLTPFIRFRNPIFIFLFFFAITTALNLSYIHMPPVWDSIAVFSSAIYLYEHSFDFSGLLKQTGYAYGGPNIYSFSLISFLTYFFISITKGNPALFLPALHIVQFLFSAVALTATFFAASKLFDWRVALLITFAVLFYPLFLVQTGYVYTEIAGAALFMCAIYAWASRYFLASVLLAALACMVKSFGIVLICSLVFLFLIDTAIPRRQRLLWVSTSMLLMIGIEIMTVSSYVHGSFHHICRGYWLELFSVLDTLDNMPDLFLFVLIVLIMPCVFGLRRAYSRQSAPPYHPIDIKMYRFLLNNNRISNLLILKAYSLIVRNVGYKIVTVIDTLMVFVRGDTSQRLVIAVYLVPVFFVGFLAMTPCSSGISVLHLPRYYTWILPIIFIGVIYTCKLFFCRSLKYQPNLSNNNVNRNLVMMLTVLILFSMLNRDGRFYPSLGYGRNSFSLTERSFEYLDFYNIQHDSVAGLAKLQNGLPAFVTRGEYYFLSSPLMGYVKVHLDNIFFILNKPYSSAKLDDFPDDFILLNDATNDGHGGDILKNILQSAKTNPAYSVSELAQYHRGSYSSSIFRITRRDSLRAL